MGLPLMGELVPALGKVATGQGIGEVVLSLA